RKHYMLLAEVLVGLDRPDWEKAYRGLVAAATDLASVSTDRAETLSGLGGVLHNLAMRLNDRDQLEPAKRLLEEAVRNQHLALQASPDNPAYLVFLRNHYWVLADVLKQLQQRDAAIETYRLNVPVLEKLIAVRPDEPDYPSDLGAKLNDLALLLRDR